MTRELAPELQSAMTKIVSTTGPVALSSDEAKAMRLEAVRQQAAQILNRKQRRGLKRRHG